jgi:hypothetical protein
MPEPSAMPLSSSISKPYGRASASRSESSARPAVLRSASSGSAMTRVPRIADAHGGFVDAAHRGGIARAFQAVAEQVEADRDVADRSGREGACLLQAHRRHSGCARAPSPGGAHAQQVGEHAGGRDFGPGARTLHDQRVVAVAPRGELHDVVGELQVGEGVSGRQFDQADARLPSSSRRAT